jgi:hypothetical protein
LAAAATLTACAFTDVFKPAEAGDVQFVWVGDTLVTVGTAIPFQIALQIDGAPASSPAVRVTIPDTTVITLDATGDSIIGRRPGQGDVVAWVESSLAARIDTVFRVRSRP